MPARALSRCNSLLSVFAETCDLFDADAKDDGRRRGGVYPSVFGIPPEPFVEIALPAASSRSKPAIGPDKSSKERFMPHPVIHSEIRTADPDASRAPTRARGMTQAGAEPALSGARRLSRPARPDWARTAEVARRARIQAPPADMHAIAAE